MARRRQHEIQAVDLGVGIGRLAGHDQPRGHLRIARAQPLHHRNRRVVRRAHGEQNFELRVVLLEERAQVFFQPIVDSGQRLQHADWRRHAQWRRTHRAIANRGDDGEHAIDQRAGDQGRQQKREHIYTVTSGMKNIIVGTAGHIDHGKTALVQGAHRHRRRPPGGREAPRHHHRSRLRAPAN